VPSPPTIEPVLVAELLVEGDRWPVYVHVIDHPDPRVLVDTGMTELHPAVADMDPRLRPLSEGSFDLAAIDVVVNTHLHFDHCVDGEHALLPGVRLVPAPGHTRGMQVVVVETGGRPVVVGGDVAVSHGELDEPSTEGQLRVRGLDPERVWLTHEHEPWRPRAV
jgi:N-acyl homoserine lactone hydrolase